MKYDKFIKKIAYDKKLNPFHADFSIEKLKRIFEKEKSDEMDIDKISILFFLLLSNPEYKSHYTELKILFEDEIIAHDYYLKSILHANNDYLSLKGIIEDSIQNKKQFDTMSIENLFIDTELSNVNAFDLLDELIDLLNFNFSIVKFCSGIDSISIGNDSHKENDIQFSFFYKINNYFDLLKQIYERVCFEKAKINIYGKTIEISSGNYDILFYRTISSHRIYNNLNVSISHIMDSPLLGRMLEKYKRFTKKRIQNLTFKNGYFYIRYNSLDDDNSLEKSALVFDSAMSCYHFHLSQKKKDVITEIGIIYVALQYLATNLEEFIADNIDNNTLYERYLQFRFKKSEIIQYLNKVTQLGLGKVSKHISHFENDGSKSFWTCPLLKSNNDFLLILHPAKNANILNLIDHWDNELFSNQREKGYEFENFLASEITSYCKEKNFSSYIPDQKKFKVGDEFEEIDLIWETKSTLLIGEVKCIRFPFDSRNTSNFIKKIDEATQQIIRKYNFLMKNRAHFPNIDFNKEIVLCVITNYPFVTGATINSIPIIDIGVFSSYINVGFNLKAPTTNLRLKENNKEYFYYSEDEFSQKIKMQVESPSVTNTFSKYFDKRTKEIEIPNGYKILMEEYVNNEKQSMDNI